LFISFAFRTIYGKLILSFSIICIISGLAAMAAIYSLYKVEDKISVIESFYEINQRILEVRSSEKNFLLYENKNELISTIDKLNEIKTSMDALETSGIITNHNIKNCKTEFENYYDLIHQLIRKDYSEIDFNNLKINLRTYGHDFMNCAMSMDSSTKQQIERESRNYKAIAFILILIILPICAMIGIFLARWIMTPLREIRKAVAQVMRGELSYIPVEPTKKICSECAELIDALNKMLQALEDKHQQLIQAEKLMALGKVTAGIAHEINNPLNNISLTAEILMEDISNMNCDERRGMIHDIIVQVDRAREIVRNLLDFSRARKPTEWNRVELVELMKTTLGLLKNQIRLSGVETELNLPQEPVTIMGNSSQLQQVFVNIILNALQAMKDGGKLRIEIKAASEQDKAVVEISDTGPGIPPSVMEHIFEPFFTTKHDGTGLGLSVSYGIVKEHKGDIQVISEPGQGTTFRLEFPLWL